MSRPGREKIGIGVDRMLEWGFVFIWLNQAIFSICIAVDVIGFDFL